ncbi:hypothetical protein PTTG_03732 [Puccinia triticina 1-1 BBBD Race 1]|uniref:Uncharacterized protein n=2 Tax=Puccinia triticina TaxID=208348 RepID=A0A0C4ESF7_PUCT1|nr:uncharacterized protein PtA15_8A9 [Puccinia triticina]OAV91793.1 hypothetical protein PTTG_03732 [Puccinia triticina 1-1 BBBD Race 1]WAQ87108.1 hypothetical protein PtA15_8A9 [Puccinia triticina]WAR56967.1 hypothetical protein PtB15_8B11 [Puccinia triticina]
MSDQGTQPVNRVEIYGSCDWEATIEFITRMIDQAQRQPSKAPRGDRAGQSEAIKLDPNRQLSVWKLVTKYYDALLEIRCFSIETRGTVRPTTAHAIVILCASDDKGRLSFVLKSFKSEEQIAHSRLVIVDLESEQLEEDEEWHAICFEHGFECHSSSDLDEASMSWQCCPWPSIQRNSQAVFSGSLSPLLELDHTQFVSPVSLLSNPQTGTYDQSRNDFDKDIPKGPARLTNSEVGSTDPAPCPNNSEANKFEDDFSDFVSAGTSSTQWDDQNVDTVNDTDDDTEQISSLEVEEMVHKLFGQNLPSSSADGHGDLESLVSQLDLLKLEAAGMDHRSRKRLASRVAMAVESQLGPD